MKSLRQWLTVMAHEILVALDRRVDRALDVEPDDDELGPIFGPAADRQAARLRAVLEDDTAVATWLGVS